MKPLAAGAARLGARQVVWLVTFAALVAFLPSVASGFVFDDDELVVQNPLAHDLRHVGRCFSTDLWDTPARPVGDLAPKLYRPLVCAANIVDYRLGGGAPWVFHLTNVLGHLGASALAARLALRWTGAPLAALLGALAFAIHPSRSESVVWVSGRTDVLATLFLLLSTELIVRGSGKKRAYSHFAAAGVAFLLALCSKELAVCLPLLVGVEAGIARRDQDDDPGKARRLGVAALVTLAGSVAYLVVRSRALPLRPPGLETTTMPPLAHAGYVLLSLGYYVERIVWPWPQTFYFRPVAFAGGAPVLHVPSVVVGGLAVVALLAWLASAWRRDRGLAGMIAVSGLLLLPALNVVETGVPGTTTDRLLYLPLLPLALALGREGRAGILAVAERSRLAPLLVSAVALVYSAVSWVRTLDYASDVSMWRHELELQPDNPMALGRLGQALASEGNVTEAEALLRRALSPEARRYELFANPSRCYLGLLEIHGARLADGDLPALEALLQAILSVVDGRPPDAARPASSADLPPRPADPRFRIYAANASVHLLLAGTLVASRLPNDERTRAIARRIDPAAPLDAAARFNLALALGRASDYEAARAELGRAAGPAGGSAGVSAAALALGETLTKVAAIRARARELPEPASSVARARAFLELGAYLRAARILRSAHAASPGDEDVSAAYLEALVAAKLDRDAETVAASRPARHARRRLGEARRGLSERVQGATAPPPDVAWWAPLLD